MALSRGFFRQAGRSIGRFSLAAGLIVLLFNFPYFPRFSPFPTAPAAHATPLTGLGIWSAAKASSAIIDTTITAGSMLQLKVNGSGGTMINGFDITISWDPTVLNGTSATTVGGLFNRPDFVFNATEVRPYHVRMYGVIPGNFVPANGTFFAFSMKVLTQGSTTVKVESNSTLTNPSSVPYSAVNGYFSNSPGTSDLLLASEIVSQETVTVGDPVLIRLGVRDVGPLPMLNVNVTLFANNAKLNSTVLSTVPGNSLQFVIFIWNTTGFSPGPYVMKATVATSSTDVFLGDNSLALEQITLVIHELAMVSVTAEQNSTVVTTVKQNSTVVVTATVQNLGTVDEYANVTIYANNVPIKAICRIPPCWSQQFLVRSGAIQNQFIFNWDTTMLPLGTYYLKGVVSVIPGERNVIDNTLVQSTGIAIVSGFAHDLAVQWQDQPNTPVIIGTNQTMTMIVTNNGNNTDSFTLKVLRDSQTIFQSNGVLPPTMKTTVIFVWKTISEQPGLHLVIANVTDTSALDQHLGNNRDPTSNNPDVSLSANTPPIANFTLTPPTPTPGASVFFNGTGSHTHRPDGTIKYYIWDFGDGATGGGRTITHTYGAAGRFTVKLAVWDDYGAQNATTVTITVAAPPPPQTSSLALFIGIIGAVAAIAATGLFLLRRRKTHQQFPKNQP